MRTDICLQCKKLKNIHAKGLCYSCYRKQWKKVSNKKICKSCGKLKFHHAKGLCHNCYQKIYHRDMIRASNVWRYHKIAYDLWKNVTKKCIICGFDKIVELHHLDGNHNNNSKENFIGLCPNHHKMIHSEEFKEDIIKLLKNKIANLQNKYT